MLGDPGNSCQIPNPYPEENLRKIRIGPLHMPSEKLGGSGGSVQLGARLTKLGSDVAFCYI